MRLIAIAGLLLASSASAGPQGGLKQPNVAKTVCPKVLQVGPARPGASVKVHKLTELPPADVYSAVYYQDGCPRLLNEARGQRR